MANVESEPAGEPSHCFFHATASDLSLLPIDTDRRIVWGGVPHPGGFLEISDVDYFSSHNNLSFEVTIFPSSIESFYSNFDFYKLAYHREGSVGWWYRRIVFQNFTIDGSAASLCDDVVCTGGRTCSAGECICSEGTDWSEEDEECRLPEDLCAGVVCSGERDRCVPETGECDCPEGTLWSEGSEACVDSTVCDEFPEICAGESPPLGSGPPPPGYGPGTDPAKGGGCFQLNAQAPSAAGLASLALLLLAFGFYRLRHQDRV
ncbi:MAG: hypothetical protein HY466_02575 [Deltaproteobacteria bacterium]|nr:hypothetical protein [Deltaproteobacteria bacterium]